MDQQTSFRDYEYDNRSRRTRREQFLASMNESTPYMRTRDILGSKNVMKSKNDEHLPQMEYHIAAHPSQNRPTLIMAASTRTGKSSTTSLLFVAKWSFPSISWGYFFIVQKPVSQIEEKLHMFHTLFASENLLICLVRRAKRLLPCYRISAPICRKFP